MSDQKQQEAAQKIPTMDLRQQYFKEQQRKNEELTAKQRQEQLIKGKQPAFRLRRT